MKNSSGQSYSFHGFTLDLARARLLRGGQEVKLRPKSFEVLVYLVQNSGRLVAKSELMQAIWPDSFVTDDSLVQCLIDVRRALADQSQYVRTVPRRGYIFDTEAGSGSSHGTVYEEQVEGIRILIEEGQGEGEQSRKVTGHTDMLAASSVLHRLSSRRNAVMIAALSVVLVGAIVYFSLSNNSRRDDPSSALTAAGESSEVKTLAVLPFKPFAAASSDEYLGLGMADALIMKLSRLGRITVRPTSAVRKYVAQDEDTIAAGRKLQVDAVVDGSIQKAGDKIRVTVQLMSIADGRHLWAEKFDENFTDIFAIEDSISEKVASALTLKLTSAGKTLLTKHHTESAEAYQLYLRGRYHWNKRTPEDVSKGIEYFKQAIEKDHNYALAYAGLADCYAVSSDVSGLPPKESQPEAKAAAVKALELDNTLAEAHATLGGSKLYYDWDWEGAEQEFKRAIELNPNYPTAHHWYSNLLIFTGRSDEAFKEIERARELDPISPMINEVVGWHRHLARLYDDAIALQRKAIELEPNFAPAHFGLGTSYEQKGMYEQAIAEFKKAMAIAPDDMDYMTALGHLYAVIGRRAEAQRVLEQLKKLPAQRYVSAANMALIYAGLGDKDRAFEWLGKAYEERATSLPRIKVEPRMDSLRSDARFQDLLRRVGLN